MGALQILIMCLSLYTNVLAQDDLDLHRLNQGITVESYSLELTLGENFHTSESFTGTVEIQIETPTALDNIVLHSVGITYNNPITLTTVGDASTIRTLIADHDLEDDYQKLRLTPEDSETITAGTYILKFDTFTGKLYNDMYGWYLSTYIDENDVPQFIATTQFQATYARRAFPCFDEPNLKAVFNIIINRPTDYKSLGNTAKTTNTENTQDTFAPTPKMSTYLVAFIVSKFENYGSLVADEDKTENFDVWCREEALETANFAYGISLDIMNQFDELTGISYLSVEGITKMDQVAIPDFSAGAMENWGLVTYRETRLLWDETHSTVNNKQSIANVIAHEFAHMWFGNYVTLDWWQYTWLNEGFARYYQYFMTAKVLTTWELDQQFVTDILQTVFVTDSVEGNSLNQEASTVSEVSNKFATVSYSKGASVIRMMINFLGEDQYTAGIRAYLSDNALGNTVPSQLYSALQPSATDALPASLADIMDGWTEQDGYPVVTVSRNASGLVFTQERFLFNPDTVSDYTWYVPITYTTAAAPNFADTTVKAWLAPDSNGLIMENNEEGWVLVNVHESGYYRVNYSEDLWDLLEEALTEGTVAFTAVTKAQIVDDALNLARANKLSYSKALNITSFLEGETSYYPWYSAFTSFTFLRRRIDSTSDTGKYLTQHISTLMEALYGTVSFAPNGNEHVKTMKTALTLQWACQLGNEDCIEKAMVEFAKVAANEEINADIRSTVYCAAVREDDTGANYEILWQKYVSSKLASEQSTILTALGCSRNEATLLKYLTESITDGSEIRSQDASTVFSAVLAGNPENVNTAFDFLQEHVDEIIAHYGGMNSLTSVISGIADRLTTQAQVDLFEDFIERTSDTLKDAEHQVTSALETAKANIAWAESNQEELFEWLDAKYGSAASIALNLSLLLVTAVTVFLNF